MKTHKDLTVWQDSIDMVTEIYKITRSFPKEELYGLTNQMRRCGVSIPSNIAEGAARNSEKEYIHFLYISLGSNMELDTQLRIARNLHFMTEDIFHGMIEQNSAIGKMLNGLINSIKNRRINRH